MTTAPHPPCALSVTRSEIPENFRLQGFAYVEMKSLESLPLVLQLNDRVPDFQKFPVMVKASEAEKNYLAKQASLRISEKPAFIRFSTTVISSFPFH